MKRKDLVKGQEYACGRGWRVAKIVVVDTQPYQVPLGAYISKSEPKPSLGGKGVLVDEFSLGDNRKLYRRVVSLNTIRSTWGEFLVEKKEHEEREAKKRKDRAQLDKEMIRRVEALPEELKAKREWRHHMSRYSFEDVVVDLSALEKILKEVANV